MNVFHSENLIAAKILGGILELFCSLGEVQQEPETAHGAVEQMQQVLDEVRLGTATIQRTIQQRVILCNQDESACSAESICRFDPVRNEVAGMPRRTR